jgi:hypothetical protein
MPQRKPYNPNTAYGRKKLSEENAEWKANLPPEERAKVESFSFFSVLLIVGVIILIIYLFSGSEGVMKWASH